MADLPPLFSSSSSSTQFPSLCCAHCELSPATVFCRDEALPYCSSCSSSLHSKKARSHHIVMPLRVCDQCEKSPASLTCALCGGSGEPLAFCAPCSSDLHSRKARSHHQLVAISITGKRSRHHSTESVDEHSRSREQADRNRSEYQSVKNKGNPNSAHIAERTVTTLRTVGRSRGKRLVGNPSGIKDDCHLRHVRIMMRHILVIPIPLHSVSLVGRSA